MKKFENGVLLAFGELFLKSEGVQKKLKRKLVNNISFFLRKEKIDFKIILTRERIFIKTKESKKVINIIKKTFGIAWFAESLLLNNASIDDLTILVKENYSEWIKGGKTFALRVNSQKDRQEIIKKVADKIDRGVNLDKPYREIFIEERNKNWFIYFKKQKALDGFPVGSQGNILALMSGGIDSPVATYLIAKRGVKNTWIHFHSFPLTSMASIEKIEELARIFLNYQPKLQVYFVPFSKIQKKIKTSFPAKYRVLFYRRLMLKISEKLAKKEKFQALVTGESLAQVSSQTLNNICITQQIVKIPILRPLIGQNKQEIIDLAKEIGTFDISIKPHEDCCTLFVSKGQTAEGSMELVKKLEKEISFNKLISEAIRETEVKLF